MGKQKKREPTETEKQLDVWKKQCMRNHYILMALMDLIEKGQLVRNTDDDHKEDWHIEMIKFVKTIKDADDTVNDTNDMVINDPDWVRLGEEYYRPRKQM